MRGFITFFVNYHSDLGQTPDEVLNLHKIHNKAVVEKVQDAGYEVMFVACTKEACRVEKVDFDQPFPRYVPGKPRLLENVKKEDS